MANRHGRDIGRQGRDREHSGGGGDYGRRDLGRSSGFGSTPFGDDERYFGGSRRFGEGYSGESYRDFDTEDRDYGSLGSGYNRGDSDENYGGSEGSRYRQGNEYSQGWGRGQYDRPSGGGGSMGGRSTRGMSRGGGYSGGSGGFSSRSGEYGGYGGSRSEERFGGQGGEDVGRYRSGYGSGYPSSERNYGQDYDQGDDRGWWEKTSDEVASWFGDEDAARRRQRDSGGSGGHRGRGPSGYTRSDDRMKEDINDRLTDYDYIDATNITVEVQGGDVTLTGTVNSRYEKRLAEDIAEDISGVKNVENRLRVSSAGTGHDQGTLGQSMTMQSGESSTGTSGAGTTGAAGTASGTQAKGKSSGS